MSATASKRTIGIWVFSLLAGVFGIATVASSSSVLFIDGEARQAAGYYVPFVIWFNFGAGFIYVITGIALWLKKPSAAWLAAFLAASTLAIFAAFGLHIVNGNEYETRTVMAMSLRSGIWIVIAVFTWNRLIRNPG